MIEFTTSSNIVPEFDTGYPKILNLDQTSVDFEFKLNTYAYVYYVVLPSSLAAPSSEQIQVAKDGDGIPAYLNYSNVTQM